jgi:hypothetical protein
MKCFNKYSFRDVIQRGRWLYLTDEGQSNTQDKFGVEPSAAYITGIRSLIWILNIKRGKRTHMTSAL